MAKPKLIVPDTEIILPKGKKIVKEAVIFDLDGTLANHRHRLHHMNKKPKDWKAFFEAMGEDKVHDYVALLYQMVATCRITPIVTTGRPSNYMFKTVDWFRDVAKLQLYKMLMRPEGDEREDHILKKEMLNALRADGFKILWAVDDRPSVVKMWRENDVPCFQVDASAWESYDGRK